MMRPGREEQCLPEEDATPKRDAGTHGQAGPRGTRRCPIPALPGPSGDALECHFVALLGIAVQATTFVARLVIILILQQRALRRICSAVPGVTTS